MEISILYCRFTGSSVHQTPWLFKSLHFVISDHGLSSAPYICGEMAISSVALNRGEHEMKRCYHEGHGLWYFSRLVLIICFGPIGDVLRPPFLLMHVISDHGLSSAPYICGEMAISSVALNRGEHEMAIQISSFHALLG
jgi:hypothetical protein